MWLVFLTSKKAEDTSHKEKCLLILRLRHNVARSSTMLHIERP
jgi:hypothetical protein